MAQRRAEKPKKVRISQKQQQLYSRLRICQDMEVVTLPEYSVNLPKEEAISQNGGHKPGKNCVLPIMFNDRKIEHGCDNAH